jgi:DNA-binding CsgD family transcriptional regulator
MRFAHRTFVVVLARNTMNTRSVKLDRSLSAGVLAVALLNLVSTLALPAHARVPRPSVAVLVLWTILLVAHGAAYWLGGRLRERLGLVASLAAQALIVFALGVSGALFPIAAALYVVLTAYAVVLTHRIWGTIGVTLGAIAVFTLNAALVQDLYRAATWGLLLAIVSVVAHAIAALLERPATITTPTSTGLEASTAALSKLTIREREVLEALVGGARNDQIARDLGITERTVKTHLARVFQKLGVESRTAAVSVALRSQSVGTKT